MLTAPRREPVWVRLRRAAALVVTVAVMAAGVVSIVGQVLAWISPTPTPPRVAAVSDADFAAVAVPFTVDYLSWSDRETRQVALARSAAPGNSVDGWGGTGRQWADSPTALGVTRSPDNSDGNRNDDPNGARDGSGGGSGDRAVVTVRVRVIPFTAPNSTSQAPSSSESSSESSPESLPGASPGQSQPAPSPAPSPESGEEPGESSGVPNVASGPVPNEPGWVAGVPRWLNLAVPVAMRDGRVVVTAVPALVGSPQAGAYEPAVPQDQTSEDTEFARDTRGTVTTLLRAYASGDLQYARAVGTTFHGLDHAASLTEVTAWRVRNTDTAAGTGEGERVRVGDVTVRWELSGGAGTLRCTYRVELRNDNAHNADTTAGGGGSGGRWYLASIGVPTEAVT